MFSFQRFATFILSLVVIIWFSSVLFHQNAFAKSPKIECYSRGKEKVDSLIPCCKGLQQVTEVKTKKCFCDKPANESSKTMVWISLFAFPIVLLIIIIFGIRNKIIKKRNRTSFNS